MATTTNYSWTTPDDTSLVKDGAAAIRSLGTSIDTTTKALNPSTTLGDIEYRSSTANTNTRLPIGTTGQVLAVVGGVPAWATTADQTPLTTKGDLFTFTTVDARLGVGANGTVLTADSAESSGLKWATPAAGGMTLLSTTTLSGASTTISSISQDYKDLQIVISGVTNATADGNFGMDPNSNSGLAYTVWSRGATLNNSAAESLWLNYFNTYQPLRTSAANNWTLTLNNYADTTQYKSFSYFGGYTTSVNLYPTIGYGTIATNTAISSLLFKNTGGNLSTGTVKIYGVK